MPVVLHQFASNWDLPNPSPFCLKAETWLRLAKIEYTTAVWTPGLSPTRKAPAVRLDDTLIADSGSIIERLTAHFDVQLDAHLDAAQHAKGHLVRRTLEEHTYWALLIERWVDDAGFRKYAAVIGYALPALLRPLILPSLRRGVKKSTHAHGLARHAPAEIEARARADYDAVERVFEGDYLLGAAPTSFDATVFAFIESAAHPMFDNALGRELRASDHWRAYRARMRAAAWSDWAERMPPLG